MNAPDQIWTYNHVGCDGIRGEWRPIDMSQMYGPMTEYRRADLPPNDAEVMAHLKVKALVWEYHPAGAIAAPPTGHTYIIDTRMKGRCYSVKGFNPPREFPSMDEAKAAAQADYEWRVLEALDIKNE